jgi:hypothetical protein
MTDVAVKASDFAEVGRLTGPRAGWKYRNKHETRHVVDRTFGGHVIYVSGRYTRHAHPVTATPAQWNAWIVSTRARRAF